MSGLYIHIPFCKQACYYCDFHFSTLQENRKDMTAALLTELGMRANYLNGEQVDTIYFGGGTPSLLSEPELDSLIGSIYKTYNVAASPEITLEANPDDLTTEKLMQLKRAGINRLSIGIQSFDNAVLQSLNRAHDSAVAKYCLSSAYGIGFDNISIDLIYAIPQQDDTLWRKNIELALGFHPRHISSYSLTIEEKTVFGRRAANGKFKPVDDDFSAQQLQILVERLEQENYEQYEVSNFSQPGFHSRHNSNYWKDVKYLGIGPSAHSYDGITRQYNVSNNPQYIKSIKNGIVPATHEVLTPADKVNEYLLTTLRTSWGANLFTLRLNTGVDILAQYNEYLQELQKNGLAVLNDGILRLTKRGKLLADKIASDLFILPHN